MTLLRSSIFDSLGWLEHGFGTRQDPVSQDGMATVRQIHSAICWSAAGPGCAGEGDGILTNTVGLSISIKTADCLPILVADREHRVVAAIHAGWRGTAAGIVPKVLQKMADDWKTRATDLYAAIGPGIGVCCYRVGQEVARQFGHESAGHIDLAAENRSQFLSGGVPANQIEVLPFCTHCDPEKFHSFRRDGDRAGRMISYIRILAG